MKIKLDRLKVERTQDGLRWEWFVSGWDEPVIIGCEPFASSIVFDGIQPVIDLGKVEAEAFMHPGLLAAVEKGRDHGLHD